MKVFAGNYLTISMVWNDTTVEKYQVPEDVVDLLFKINCPQLPLDNAYALSQAVVAVLPWLADEDVAGIHLIRGAETANGWQRPEDSVLHLSKRTRFILRLPQTRLAAAHALVNQTLNIDGYTMHIGAAHVRPLSALTTVFARQVVTRQDDSESEFTDRSVARLETQGIVVNKLLCGRLHTLHTPAETLYVRSMLLADLQVEHSVLLQQRGLGSHLKLGCGIFVPHKSIQSVHDITEN